ncbi:SAP domain-containing ribonucleoprotein-like [Actinia tenebrosa]|uniref:SAP domain-containing ribonucleoprotein-like n=1 Tax=Actinia tenebrosa TaxID=6105 RepID=A0A6P8IY28_ACTTE|nr:SAP domain-containing ribonucleoprotein-like [Actinia tenebrosa]
MADALNVKKMKVAELRKELAVHGLDIKGNKNDLKERLKEFLRQQGHEVDHSEDAGDEEVEDDLEPATGDDEEEEISDDVLAEESLEQKPESNKVTPLNGAENKDPLPEVVQTKKTVQTPIKQAVTAKTVITKPLTEEERKLQRMKRFGSPASEENKKLSRAQRFGSNTSSISSPESGDLAKLKKRAERFGAVSPVVSKIEDQDRLLKRKERFGASLITADDSIEAKKKKRAERFST